MASPSKTRATALRRAVLPDVREFVSRTFATGEPVYCALTGWPLRRSREANCDHAPPWTFKAIRHAYVAAFGFPEIVRFDEFGFPAIADPLVREHWRAFHSERAQLRIVCSEAHRRQNHELQVAMARAAREMSL